MRVLVVEDDVQLARRIASALTEAGHDAVAVHDGEGALDKATVTPFDLIVLDIILPGMDGFDVLRHLRRQHLASRVRVWEHEHEYDTKLVEVFIGRLRKKIGNPPLVHTVHYVGYTIREAP